MARTMSEEPHLGKVLLVAYLPTFIYSIGQGAIVPVIPAVAESLGAGLGFAGFIAGALLIGQALGDLPAGWVVSRIGERWAMIFSALATIVGALLSVTATSPWQLLAGIVLQGMMAATFALARQSFMSTYVPFPYRARAMSTLGGVFRSGMFVGPFLASLMIGLTGDPQINFWVFIGCALLVVIVLFVLPDLEKTVPANLTPEQFAEKKHEPVFRTIRRHGGVLVRLGAGAGILQALRVSRQVLLPLWALSIGMDPGAAAFIIGVGGGIDFALFFTSGWIMDRFGRSASAVPALAGLGLGFAALAFLHDIDSAQLWFAIITCWLALSNGVGSGIVMTLGADLADPEDPAPFLGAWRMITDGSGASVPFLVAGLQQLVGISLTAGFFGVLGAVGACIMYRYIPRYISGPVKEPPAKTGPIPLDGSA